MKSKIKAPKIISLILLFVLLFVNQTYANWIYERNEEHVADQHVYNDVCQRVTRVTIKLFGITIKDEMRFEVYKCDQP